MYHKSDQRVDKCGLLVVRVTISRVNFFRCCILFTEARHNNIRIPLNTFSIRPASFLIVDSDDYLLIKPPCAEKHYNMNSFSLAHIAAQDFQDFGILLFQLFYHILHHYTMESTLSPDIIDQIRKGPAAAPPPGIIPDFDNPPNSNSIAISAIIASLVIAALVCLLRLYSRVFCTKNVKIEDCSFILALGNCFK